MLRFERTRNLKMVRAILTNPGIWPYIGDDFAPAREAFQPNSDERIWYVMALEGTGMLVGLFMFVPESPVCWQVHVSMLRKVKPSVTHQAGRDIVPWIWEHTDCRRLVASVPVSNRAAVRFGARAMGLTVFGRNEASFMKHGKLQDQILIGISRPEI